MMTPPQILKGCEGLSRAAIAKATGIGLASDAVIAARRDQCRECPHATRNQKLLERPSKGLTTLSKCQLCGCVISAKTILASEFCPDKRWGSAE